MTMKSHSPAPLYFEAAGTPLFGWLHAGAPGASTGIVMCSAWGREELCAHRAWRELAQQLSAQGWPVLRFDYQGCGDSFDADEAHDDAWAGWLESTRSAIGVLKQRARVDRVALLGLRMGATLAVQAAVGRADVAALVAVAPVVSGRAYTRELRALQAATAVAAPSPAVGEALESGGFVLAAGTSRSLAALDLRRLPAPTAPLLVIDRDDLPSAGAWVGELEAQGLTPQRRLAPGFAELMLDPHASRTPLQMWQAVLEGLEGLLRPAGHAESALTAPAPIAAPIAASIAASMRAASAKLAQVEESAFELSVDDTLLRGIETRASGVAASGHAIVLLNAGATRRVGPNRMWVTLARRWAGQGHRVLRVDLAGLGDSDVRNGRATNVVYARDAVREVCALVKALLAHDGIRACHLVGLCSGAYHGFKAAVQGAPVGSVTVINPLTFEWREGMSLDAPLPDHKVASEMERYKSIAWSAGPWLKLLRGQINVFGLLGRLGRGLALRGSHRARDLARTLKLPVRADLTDDLESVAGRKARLQFIFSQGDPGQGLLKTQAGKAMLRLQRSGALGISVIANADHTFSPWAARLELIELLVRQMQEL